MASRAHDWINQGRRDLEHASHALGVGHYEWACFASHQAAEKAVKGLFQHLGGEAWGHAVAELLLALPEVARPTEDLVDLARELDKHYIPTRYPNAHAQGAPFQLYTRGEAQRAIQYAEQIIGYCEGLLAR